MSDESPIIFTDSCCAKVADLIAEENNPDLMLRVFVNGGGCSGFQYGFTFLGLKLIFWQFKSSLHFGKECQAAFLFIKTEYYCVQ